MLYLVRSFENIRKKRNIYKLCYNEVPGYICIAAAADNSQFEKINEIFNILYKHVRNEYRGNLYNMKKVIKDVLNQA